MSRIRKLFSGYLLIFLLGLLVIVVPGCEKKPSGQGAPAGRPLQNAANAPAIPPIKSVVELNARIAAAKPNEVILVPAGVYDVDVAQGVQIAGKQGFTLKAAAGRAELVSRKPDGQIVRISNSKNITLEGFTIYHAVDVSCAADCVSIEASSGITIKDNDISGSGAYGVGVWGSENSDIHITGNTIHDCTYFGVEFHAKGGEITNNKFTDNGGPGGSANITGELTGVDVRDNDESGSKEKASDAEGGRSYFARDLALGDGCFLKIRESEKAVSFELLCSRRAVGRASVEFAGIREDNIQQVTLKNGTEVYFITAWDRGSTFGAQTNVVVWKSSTGWSLVTAPFLRGFVEDKELTGRYDLVDTFPEEKHYQFEQGRFIKVGK